MPYFSSLKPLSSRGWPSQPISKSHILPIRLIFELYITLVYHPSVRLQLVSASILENVIGLQHSNEYTRDRADHDDGHFGGDVLRRGLGGEGEGSENVAETKGHEEKGIHCDLRKKRKGYKVDVV